MCLLNVQFHDFSAVLMYFSIQVINFLSVLMDEAGNDFDENLSKVA